MKDKYVLDSSVWVEIERGNSEILEYVEPMIQKNCVCLIDVIVAELLRGTRSIKDFRRLKLAFADFVQLSVRWELVAELAFKVARKGFNPPLIDLYIAQCVIEQRKILLTQDKHFQQIQKVQPFRLRMI